MVEGVRDDGSVSGGMGGLCWGVVWWVGGDGPVSEKLEGKEQ